MTSAAVGIRNYTNSNSISLFFFSAVAGIPDEPWSHS